MAYKTGTKTTSAVENYLNWAEVSKFLTGGTDRIRKNRIPKLHEGRIEELFTYIQAWKDNKKLFSETQLKEALSKIDTKTILMVEMGIVDKEENH
jgi:hypothetical protein